MVSIQISKKLSHPWSIIVHTYLHLCHRYNLHTCMYIIVLSYMYIVLALFVFQYPALKQLFDLKGHKAEIEDITCHPTEYKVQVHVLCQYIPYSTTSTSHTIYFA